MMPLNEEDDEICYQIKAVSGSTKVLLFTTEMIYCLDTEPLYRHTLEENELFKPQNVIQNTDHMIVADVILELIPGSLYLMCSVDEK
jgi:hypothetical protein